MRHKVLGNQPVHKHFNIVKSDWNLHRTNVSLQNILQLANIYVINDPVMQSRWLSQLQQVLPGSFSLRESTWILINSYRRSENEIVLDAITQTFCYPLCQQVEMCSRWRCWVIAERQRDICQFLIIFCYRVSEITPKRAVKDGGQIQGQANLKCHQNSFSAPSHQQTLKLYVRGGTPFVWKTLPYFMMWWRGLTSDHNLPDVFRHPTAMTSIRSWHNDSEHTTVSWTEGFFWRCIMGFFNKNTTLMNALAVPRSQPNWTHMGDFGPTC